MTRDQCIVGRFIAGRKYPATVQLLDSIFENEGFVEIYKFRNVLNEKVHQFC